MRRSLNKSCAMSCGHLPFSTLLMRAVMEVRRWGPDSCDCTRSTTCWCLIPSASPAESAGRIWWPGRPHLRTPEGNVCRWWLSTRMWEWCFPCSLVTLAAEKSAIMSKEQRRLMAARMYYHSPLWMRLQLPLMLTDYACMQNFSFDWAFLWPIYVGRADNIKHFMLHCWWYKTM